LIPVNNSLTIKVTWKCTGEGLHRPDLLARYLRNNLPKVLSRLEIEPEIRKPGESQPTGWDDYFVFPSYRISLD